MIGLKKMLLEEEERLEKIIRQCKGELEKAPEGSVQISNSRNRVQFYHYDKSKKRGSYIRKSNQKLVDQLIQKSYYQKILSYSENEIKFIQKLLENYDENGISNIYLEEHPERKSRIIPIEKTWDTIVEEWLSVEYEGKEFYDDIPEIYTEQGERVRSKSEKILADYFYHRKIPYKYECPLYVRGYGTIYPDFTLLSRRTGKEIYWEHFGIMDDESYAKSTVRKLNTYVRNGIVLGENLLATFETRDIVLNTELVAHYVEEYLL